MAGLSAEKERMIKKCFKDHVGSLPSGKIDEEFLSFFRSNIDSMKISVSKIYYVDYSGYVSGDYHYEYKYYSLYEPQYFRSSIDFTDLPFSGSTVTDHVPSGNEGFATSKALSVLKDEGYRWVQRNMSSDDTFVSGSVHSIQIDKSSYRQTVKEETVYSIEFVYKRRKESISVNTRDMGRVYLSYACTTQNRLGDFGKNAVRVAYVAYLAILCALTYFFSACSFCEEGTFLRLLAAIVYFFVFSVAGVWLLVMIKVFMRCVTEEDPLPSDWVFLTLCSTGILALNVITPILGFCV